ncbi:MAG: peptide synthase, partial [Elusimicrobiota bacterium]
LVAVGEKPVLCVEKESTTKMSDTDLTKELLAIGARHSHTSGITTILFHPSFPVDIRHNAKISREVLSVWAAGRLS